MTKLQAVGELLVGFIKSIIHIVWLHRIPKVIQRLQERGTFTVNRADCGAPRRRHTPNFEEDVLHRVEEIPSTNTRTIVCGMGVPHSTVWEVLHEQQLHSYHPQRVHAMGPGNFALRTNFCVWFLHCCVEETQFPWQILFTDECRFTRVTVLNSRNRHVWDDKNPHAQDAHGSQQCFGINVWASIVDGRLIGPYLLPPRLTGHAYLPANYWKLCHWTSVDASGFNMMVYHPILQVWFVITLTDALGRDG